MAAHTKAEDLSVLKPGDLLIAISFNPYTKDTAEAFRIDKQQAVDITVITDSLSTPLAIEADSFLITSTVGDYFFSLIVAPIICIATLLSKLLKQLGDKAIQRFNHTEYVLGNWKLKYMKTLKISYYVFRIRDAKDAE